MPFDLPPPDPAAEIFVSSHGMSKGIGQSDGPQIIPKASLRLGAVQFGAQWKNVTSTSANGEGALFANASRKIGALQLTAGVAYKFQTGVRGHPDSRSFEFTAGATRKFGRLSARINAVYSPDDLGSAKQSLYIEGGPALDIGRGWTISGAVGSRSRRDGQDYHSFNAGIGKSLKSLQLDLRYYDTDRSSVGDPYHARLVASARLSF
jgi:uncharacterized protein (TIGR02001 family)